jgi:hypothetical protein
MRVPAEPVAAFHFVGQVVVAHAGEGVLATPGYPESQPGRGGRRDGDGGRDGVLHHAVSRTQRRHADFIIRAYLESGTDHLAAQDGARVLEALRPVLAVQAERLAVAGGEHVGEGQRVQPGLGVFCGEAHLQAARGGWGVV